MKKIMNVFDFLADYAGPIIYGLIVLFFALYLAFGLSNYVEINAQCYNACYPNIVLELNKDFCVCAPEKIIWRKDIK